MPVDPQVADFLKVLESDPRPSWEELGLEQSRQLFDTFEQFAIPPEHIEHTEDIRIADRFLVRVYRPAGAERPPVVVYLHGGGWVLGGVASHDSCCRRLANQSGCCVVSVDYRLAPETAFPGAVDDAMEALCYVADEADSLGVDANRIAVAGDSAGGNLAAAAAYRCGRSRLVSLAAQMLIYPVVDPACDSPSYAEFADGYGLTAETMRWFWKQYLQSPGDEGNPLANLTQIESWEVFPKTLVLTAEYDVLRDEGERLARSLSAAGVDCQLRRGDGLIHGFYHFTRLFDRGLEFVDESAAWLRDQLEIGAAVGN